MQRTDRAGFLTGVLVLMCLVPLSALEAQDGASFNPRAKEYRPPANSLAGATNTPDRLRAIAPLWQGDMEKALPALKQLAESGDVPTALLLASLYRKKGNLPVQVDPAQALHFYLLASKEGSGEASERVAEMVEEKEIPVPALGGEDYWRDLAVKQGWKEQRFAAYCFAWKHGPEPLHCEARSASHDGTMPPEVTAQCPNQGEMKLMQQEGLTGEISVNGGAIRLDHGPQARAILLVDHAVPGEADLLEPDAVSVIYIQTPTDHWRMLPPSAPLLNRFLMITPGGAGRGVMSIGAQAMDGSQSGGMCAAFTN